MRDADRLSVLSDLARVLRVDVGALTGRQPPHDPGTLDVKDDLSAIRRVMTSYPTLVESSKGVAAPEESLTLRVTEAHRRYQAADYQSVMSELPDILVHADRARASSPHNDSAILTSVWAYVAAAKLLCKLGVEDLTAIAADRAVNASVAVRSLAAQGAAIYQGACALLQRGHVNEAQDLAVSMAEHSTAACETDATPSLISTSGALWLLAALAAARGADGVKVNRWLAEADALARRLGTDQNHAWTAFGPTNVAIHRVSVAAEIGDPAAAVAAAVAVDIDRLPTGLRSRRSQIHLDLAWAQPRRKRDADATLHLLEAERVTPESIRYNISARGTILGTTIASAAAAESRSHGPCLSGKYSALADR